MATAVGSGSEFGMTLRCRTGKRVGTAVGLAMVCALAPLLCGRRIAAQTAQSVQKTSPAAVATPAEDGPPSSVSSKSPEITYEDGQLTIIAENVPISEIMKKLHALLGLEVDLPVETANERMWVRLGPGPPRKVVSDMLSTTELNYVIQGSEDDSDGIQTVSLSAREKTGGPSATHDAQERVAGYQTQRGNNRVESSADVENTAAAVPPVNAAATGPSAKDKSATAGDGTAQTASAADAAVAPPDPPDPEASKGSNGKSSAQMILQLQSMYEQRRQMQQQSQQTPPASQSQ
jgi:hypothetical protein